jgi:hypothetical protein
VTHYRVCMQEWVWIHNGRFVFTINEHQGQWVMKDHKECISKLCTVMKYTFPFFFIYVHLSNCCAVHEKMLNENEH